MDHVTVGFATPVTDAVNCWVWPSVSVTVDGEMVTVRLGTSVTWAVAVDPSLAGAPPVSGPTHGLATLSARAISAWFGDRKVLDRVDLDMPAGQVTALIGPSGCGKSTFLRILNRMHELVGTASLAGEVLLDGEDVYDRSQQLTDVRRQIGMVFQKPNPFPAMSIYNNVVAGLKLTGTRSNRSGKDDLAALESAP